MSYIESNLAKDETIVARLKHSWTAIVPDIILLPVYCAVGIVLITVICPLVVNVEEIAESSTLTTLLKVLIDGAGAVAIAVGLFFLISSAIDIRCTQLIVTNKRMLGRYGFISKRTTDIMLNKIDTINADNSFWGAIFHYGRITVVSAASGGLTFDCISNTMEFRKAVLGAIEKAKAQEREEQAKALRDAMKPNEPT